MKITTTVEADIEEKGVYHIPGNFNMQNTLCGFVDVLHKEYDFEEHPCNCKLCLEIFKEVKAYKFPKGYFKEVK